MADAVSSVTANENPKSLFPTLPVAAYGILLLAIAFVVIVPAVNRSDALHEPAVFYRSGTKYTVYPTWKGESFIGRCQLMGLFIEPGSHMGKRFAQELGENVIALRLSFDNEKGVRDVSFDTSSARLYDFIGRGIPSIPEEELRAQAKDASFLDKQGHGQTIKPGTMIPAHYIFFHKDEVLPRLDRLYALQFTVDGKPYNLQGIFVTAEEEAHRQGAILDTLEKQKSAASSR